MAVYDSDASLPALPLPMLNITAAFCKQQMRPFCPEEMWDTVQRCVDELKGQGQLLQKELREHAESMGGNASWLRPLWDNEVLGSRRPLPLHRAYSLQLSTHLWGSQAFPALIMGMSRFFHRLSREDLPVESGDAGPLSMDSLRWLAYERIPGRHTDRLFPLALSGRIEIAVVHRGHWFAVGVSDGSGRFISSTSMAKALHAIRNIAPNLVIESAVGALTAAERDEADRLRTRLLEHSVNRVSLHTLEKCLFVVALDDAYQGDNFGHNLLAGNAACRWFDKSIHLIEGPRGEVGVRFNDPGCGMDLLLYALAQMDEDLQQALHHVEENTTPAGVRHLPFYVDSLLSKDISACRERYDDTIGKMSSASLVIPDLSKGAIKAIGCAPRLFTILALQAAYYRLTSGIAAVYEPVSGRRYYQGVVGGNHPADSEAVAFIKALGGDGGLRELYAAAETTDRDRLERCAKGQSPEEHLFGIKTMAELMEHSPRPLSLPDLFAEPVWLACGERTMSVSEISTSYTAYAGIGPQEDDGLGIGFVIRDDGLYLSVAANTGCKVSAREFVDAVEEIGGIMLAGLRS